MFVTHDRTFLQKIATRIVEIDRGKLFSFSCNYTTYLERRQAMQDAEEKQWQTFDKKLAQGGNLDPAGCESPPHAQ
jgi:ATP-binding cassette subfamily F protein uup